MTDKKINNNGFSLVEVLLVIFILSIVVTFVSYSISLIYSRDAEKCAKMINSALETTRMSSLAQEGKFFLSIDGEHHLLKIESSETGIVSQEKLPERVDISVIAQGSTDFSGDNAIIEFDKATGKVKDVTIDGLSIGADTYNTVMISAITNGTGKKVSVMMIKMTGKHYLVYGDS